MHSDDRETLRGFTLIELLVVIAIIGVLSGVVLASVTTARTRGNDTAVRANLTGARTQAELFYSVNTTGYTGICSNTTVGGVRSIYNHIQEAAEATGLAGFSPNTAGNTSGTNAVCNMSASAWAAQVPLKAATSTWFCVDSTGKAVTSTTTLLASGTDVAC